MSKLNGSCAHVSLPVQPRNEALGSPPRGPAPAFCMSGLRSSQQRVAMGAARKRLLSLAAGASTVLQIRLLVVLSPAHP